MEGNRRVTMQDERQVDQESAPVEDVDVKSPTGAAGKIIVTVIILLALAAGAAAVYYFSLKPNAERKALLQKHDDFMSAYTALRATGYDDFWKCVFPLATEEQANSNLKLESIIKAAVTQNEEGFGKHILECVPMLKKHIDGAKGLTGPAEYAESVQQLPQTLEAVYDAWKTIGDRFAGAGARNKWDKRLDEVTAKGWGLMYVDYEKRRKSTDETMRNARRYMRFVTCAVGKTYQQLGASVSEVETALVATVLGGGGLCSTPEKAMERGDYIESNCVTFLVSSDPPPVDADWDFVVKRGMYYETRSLAVIAGSWEGQDGCLRAARKEKEKFLIQNLFNAWVAYKKVAKGIEDIYRKRTSELKKK
jgi:hypothetical protein